MDTGQLVEQKVNEARRLLKEIERGGVAVPVAFWAKTGDGKWHLYIASPAVDALGLAAAYRAVFEALDRLLKPTTITPADVKLLRSSDPMAQDALEIQRRHQGPGPIGYSGYRLGETPIDLAYIYPPSPYDLTPSDVLARVVALMMQRQPGQPVPPSRVTLRDSSTRQGLPKGFEMNSGGQMVIKFLEVPGGQELTIPASDVIGID